MRNVSKAVPQSITPGVKDAKEEEMNKSYCFIRPAIIPLDFLFQVMRNGANLMANVHITIVP